MFTLINFLKNNWLESIGILFSILYLYYSIKRKLWLWIVGFVSSGIYVFVFYQEALLPDIILNSFYAIISVYGFIAWLRDKENLNKETYQIEVRQIQPENVVLTIIYWIILYFVMFFFISYLPENANIQIASFPILDSLVISLSFIATWMLTQKYIEQWLIWIFVDATYIFIYYYNELYLTSFLFIVYTIMAIIGYISWYKRLIIQERKNVRKAL